MTKIRVSTVKRDGSVKKGSVSGSSSSRKSNSSKSSNSSSRRSSSSSSNNLVSERVPVGGGEREFSSDGGRSWSRTRPSSSRRSSSSSSGPTPAKGFTVEATMEDTRTGEITKTVSRADTGREISRTTTRKSPQERIRDILEKDREPNQQRLTREDIRSSISRVSNQRAQRRQEINNLPQLKASDRQRENTSRARTPFGRALDTAGFIAKSGAQSLSSSAREESSKRDSANRAKVIGLNTGAFVLSSAVSAKEFFIDPLRTPIQSAKDTVQGLASLGTQEGRRQFSASAGQFGQRLQSGDPIAAGQVAGAVATPSIPGAALKVAGTTTRAVRLAGKTELPRSRFENPDVISGKSNMPQARGTQEIVQGFERAGGEVVTFSPQRLGKINPNTGAPTNNPITGRRQAGDTRKGSFGLEDGGINVAPAGQGTSFFTRIEKVSPETKFTVNPRKIIDSIKSEFRQPTATTFQAQGISRPPKEALDSPGFEAVKVFQKQLAGSGNVAITKRSLIGQGEIPRQSFTSQRDFTSDFNLQVIRDGQPIKTKEIRKGDILKEAGTREFELTIPQGQKIADRGITGFIKVDRKKVAIRQGELLIDNKVPGNNIPSSAGLKNQRLISTQKIATETSQLDSSFNNNVKFKSPTSPVGIAGSSLGTISRSASSGGSSSSLFSSSSSIPRSGSSSVSSSFSGTSPSSSSFSPKGSSPGSSTTGGTSPIGSGGSSGGSSSSSFTGGSSSGFGGSSGGKPPITPSRIRVPSRTEGFKPKSQQAYDVFIREKGKVIKVNKEPLPVNRAKTLGKTIVDNTVAASFEKRISGKTTMMDRPFVPLGDKFRTRKSKNALQFVEKNQNRIDTAGEKRGLTTAKYLKRFRL